MCIIDKCFIANLLEFNRTCTKGILLYYKSLAKTKPKPELDKPSNFKTFSLEMLIKIIFLLIIICQLVRAIERQHYPDITDKKCGIAKGSKCQHKHVFACHQSSCSMNFYRKNATQGEIPWAVFIFNTDQQTICSGSILNENWVLTAGHCFRNTTSDSDAKKVKVYLGLKPEPFKDTSYVTKQIKIHHLSRKDKGNIFNYDIALVELSQPIAFGPDVCCVCLPPLMFEHKDKETALFAGYGIYDNIGLSLQTGWVSFNRSHMYNKYCLKTIPNDSKRELSSG